ncbi:hypothetical protein DEAC_c27770 [Desulfosporosinus acididurans]|uniref:Putative component of 'biosynthetic module' domain-containing protein n=1 Tax=Desulfosporosinus acididurans TaxID=476652 RepID=A0A0J1FP06_9FIRM|nr:YceG family protein [Desulfosporosinus acididurans]KLU65225.1 hypothetical protein DEAC_c27770 [Desulfosporosinus acididurans]
METSPNDQMMLLEIEKLFKDLLSPLQEREGGPPAYFYRIVGCDNQKELLSRVASFAEKLQSTDNFKIWDTVIPLPSDQKIIERIKGILEPISLKDYNNGALLNVLEGKGYFSLTIDDLSPQTIREAFAIVINLYMVNDQPKNISIAMNFVTKVLLWYTDFGQLCPKNRIKPKVLYWGSPKTHEVYFLILVFLLGGDVIVINTTFNDRFDNVDKQNHFCLPIKLSQEIPLPSFPQRRPLVENSPKNISAIQSPTKAAQRPSNLISKIKTDPAIVVKLQHSDNPLQDILLPLPKRSGYISGQFPILPTLFTRYIGVPVSSDDWKAEYYNDLYNLDRTLQRSGHYLKFIEGVSAPTPVESSLIPEQFAHGSFETREDILEKILQANLLPQLKNSIFSNTLKQSFIDSANLFCDSQSHFTSSIFLNFCLKLVVWINRYLPKLLEGSDPLAKDGEGGILQEQCFKILFYGPIKLHEVYLLDFFHRIGSDVLFIHSDLDGDSTFKNFDNNGTMTQVIRNLNSLPLVLFPQKEQLIRKSTVAYNASREIEEVIYSEDVGLYKPWQFEQYLTQPITLKTTYDELKILWQEAAKIRPEFKVQNHKVYIPNLFAKINGVHEDLREYWQDLKTFAQASNTHLIKAVPFCKVTYSRQELYQADYLFNPQGYLDEDKVMKSQHYKFAYLRTPLQEFLLSKINELLYSNVFLFQIDERMKLKILMTVLTMDDSLIKLIETFDFPQEIPKLIVYDSNKESFSEFDAILIAFLNLVGLDILVFTPTKYNTLEQLIRPNLFDVFQLPLLKYDLDLPELYNIPSPSTHKQGFFSRFFNSNKL